MNKPISLISSIAVLSIILLIATDVKSAEFTEQESSDWLVVLDDPRPARSQGWLRPGYSASREYEHSLELSRFAKRFSKRHSLNLKSEWLIESVGLFCLVVSIEDNVDKKLEALRADKRVEWVQKSQSFELLAANISSLTQQSISQSSQTISQLLPKGFDGSGVSLAMVDSGVDFEHSALASVLRFNADFVDLSSGSKLIGEAHGTAMAGVIAASANTKVGLSGIAPGVKLIALRGCWEEEGNVTRCSTLSLARALDALIEQDVDILNLSLSGPNDLLLEKILSKVIKSGTQVVAAFDPNRPSNDRFPLPKKGVLIVKAHEMGLDMVSNMERSQGEKDQHDILSAPGARVVPVPGNGYKFMQGHSVAAAYMSAALAVKKHAQSESVTK